MAARYVIVGGGIAGVSCAEQVSNTICIKPTRSELLQYYTIPVHELLYYLVITTRP